ncbi:flagellar protein [Rhizobium rhizogenes]|uniref:Flagellar protein n=1 Tax=Rhizobium rhizogenes TaxID=359 RepID=A0AA88F1B1_RHIRH|nr:MotE family protein [Rhizobium rhizogenes]KAA3502852.1 flagellar protein [Rhizobium rhizogenes]
MMEHLKNKAFPNGLSRFAAVASLLLLLPAASAESQQNVVSELSTQDEIQKFCTNIADAARDQRYLMQKQELEKLQADVNERISVLEDRKAEYEDWLARREHFLAQAKANLVDVYKTMKPDAAAPQLEKMHVEIAAAIIMQLPPRQSGLILSEMDAQKAATVAGIMSQATDKNTSKDPS